MTTIAMTFVLLTDTSFDRPGRCLSIDRSQSKFREVLMTACKGHPAMAHRTDPSY